MVKKYGDTHVLYGGHFHKYGLSSPIKPFVHDRKGAVEMRQKVIVMDVEL